MGKFSLKNVCVKRGRYYFRRKIAGKDTYVRLPAFTDPSFAEEYQRIAKPDNGPRVTRRGSIAALVATYRDSSDYRSIPSDNTRRNYARYLDMIEEEHGHRTITGVTRHHIYQIRDKMQETPGKANNWLNVFKQLMEFAAKNGMRADNPAIGLKSLKLGERQPWPSEILEQALSEATPMTRLAIVSGLCSGARISDVIRMQHGWIDGSLMTLLTQKKQKEVAIPMHPFWIEELAKLERKSVTLLYDRAGKPFSSTKALQERIRSLMKKIGAPEYTFHGLRKNAACYLVELNLSDQEVGAILAMTPDTVRHYSKKARVLKLAKGAADRVTRGDVLTLKGGRQSGVQ
jgi:integrase